MKYAYSFSIMLCSVFGCDLLDTGVSIFVFYHAVPSL